MKPKISNCAVWNFDLRFSKLKANRRASTRPGLSLLEIIIALAILTGTAALLAQMVDLGARHAERARQMTEAQTWAHNILNELLLGLRPWESSDNLQPVDMWSPWDYRVEYEPLDFGDLISVTVTVVERTETAPGTRIEPAAMDQRQVANPRQYRVTRWVERPAEFLDGTGVVTEDVTAKTQP